MDHAWNRVRLPLGACKWTACIKYRSVMHFSSIYVQHEQVILLIALLKLNLLFLTSAQSCMDICPLVSKVQSLQVIF